MSIQLTAIARLTRTALLPLLVSLSVTAAASGQPLPSDTVSIAGGRIVLGGELFVTIGEDDPGWFNYTDYEYSGLRNLRASLSTELRPSRRLQFLAEVRLDHGEYLSAYALFVRVRPWPERRFDIQAGRVPPTFGAFNRTVYAYDNLVIGQPTPYQYLLTLRSDAVPRTADELLANRGDGWLTGYSAGDQTRAPGLPLVNSNRYDTGVQVHGVTGPVEWTGAVTTGSLSDPRWTDNNGQPQLVGRATVQLGPALRIGGSAARGAWLDASLEGTLPNGTRARHYKQQAFAVDAELSAGRWLVRGELLRATWNLPVLSTPAVTDPVAAHAVIVEGRYKLWPGVSLAARADALNFGDLAGTGRTMAWEAPVRRLETAVSVSITRNAAAKLAWQLNRREGGGLRHDALTAAQLVYWF